VKVLVTGREGQLAQSLSERGNGHPQLELLLAARPDTDLSIPGSVAKAIETARPDLVINAAAYTDVDGAEDEPELAYRINAEAAGEAARAAADIGAPIIQMSTDYVFDGQLERPYREDDPVNPINVYGASKAAGEERVRSANARHLILRTSWVVSPFGRNFVKTMVEAARSRDLLTVVDDQHGCPTSALDIADAILEIVGGWADGGGYGQGRTFHLAAGGETSWFGLASAVMDECARLGAPSARIEPIGSAEWPTRASRPRNSILDNSRFEREFGFALPPWRESLPALVQRILDCQ
jgi:dTDP-4-dehydrorhamnose reductase